MAYTVTNNPWSSQYSVGVGTDTPETFGALAVRRGVSINSKNVSLSTSDAYYSTFDVRHLVGSIVDLSSQNSNLTFSTSATTSDGIERMRITQAGNVGIGTDSPATRLQIKGTNTYHQISACFFSTYNAGFSFSDDLAGITYDAGTNSLCLYSDYTGYGKVVISTCGAPRLTATVNGNIGIGCVTPRNTLEIVGGTSSPALCATNCDLMKIAGNTNSSLSIGSTVVSPYPIWIQVKHQSVDNLTYPLSLQTCGGNVGIGILNPGSYKLYVNGSFYSAGSSCEYKQSICNYNTDSCLFMKLKPVTYQYKDEYCHLGKELKSGTQIGLIAEDTAEVFPELAILKEEENEKVVRNVDYEKLTIILLSELQKLRQEVDQLKNK